MNKAECVILNGILGDQLGAPYEFKTHEEIKEIYSSGKKLQGQRYTDDSLMTMALVLFFNDYVENYPLEKVMDYYAKTYQPNRVYGPNTEATILKYMQFNAVTESSSQYSGSIMRACPAVFVKDTDTNYLAYVVSYPTHIHHVTFEVTKIYIDFMRFLLAVPHDDLYDRIIDYISKVKINNLNPLKKQIKYILDNLNSDEIKVAKELMGTDNSICYTVFSCSIWCLINHLDDPKGIIHRVILYGGDTDTTAKITGEMIAAIYGNDAIDMKLMKGLEGIDPAIRQVISLIGD